VVGFRGGFEAAFGGLTGAAATEAQVLRESPVSWSAEGERDRILAEYAYFKACAMPSLAAIAISSYNRAWGSSF